MAPSSTASRYPRPPFLVRDALRAGVPEGVLRSRRYCAPVPGVRMDARLQADLVAVCRAVALTLSDGAAFCGPTAAALWDLPLERRTRAAALERLHAVGTGGRPSAAARVVGRRGLAPGDRTSHLGVPVTTPLRTWRDLGAVDLSDSTRVPHPAGVDPRHEELVVATDALVASDAMHGDVPRYGLRRLDLERAAESWTGVRGVRSLRSAVADARQFVDSAPETRVRLRVVASGFPCPVVGADLVTASGLWLARPDLCWPEIGVAIEYDGEHHVDRRQLASDTARRDAMDAIGWRCIVLYQEDVGSRWSRTIRRLRDAFTDQGCVDPGRIASAPDTVERRRIVCTRLAARR